MNDNNPEVEIILACAYGDVGARLRPNATLRDWLIANGFARMSEAASPARPGKLTGKAAQKIADATRTLFKG